MTRRRKRFRVFLYNQEVSRTLTTPAMFAAKSLLNLVPEYFMKRSIVKTALIAATLLLSASLSLAVEHKTGSAGETKAISKAKATSDKAAKATKAEAAAKANPVDINSASKAELKKLPGISGAAADKIIAGRPYLSKAKLVTENILPRETYDGLKALVIAKQNKASAAKLGKLQKERASR